MGNQEADQFESTVGSLWGWQVAPYLRILNTKTSSRPPLGCRQPVGQDVSAYD